MSLPSAGVPPSRSSVAQSLSKGKPVCCAQRPLGFRQFKWDYDQNRLILNGQKVIIHGSNRHQEYPWSGDAAPKWLQLADMRDNRL